MNTYSKALRHISMKDVKQKHQQKLTEQKLQEEVKKKEKQYIKSVMETKKYDWRKEIERVDNKVEEEVIVNTVDDFGYDWRGELVRDRSKYFETEYLEERMTTSDVFSTILNPPENTYDNPIVTSSTTTISYLNAINSSTRLITLGTFDVSSIDQFEVDATRLGSGGSSYGWVLQANGTVIAAGGENDPIRVANASELALFKSGKVTFTIRQSTIPAFGDNATSPSVTGWTINNVKFYRTVPTNVFVSLDSPEASAFIRNDPFLSSLSPEERKQKLKEMLQASDEYLTKMLGSNFPGTGAVPPGESGDIPGVEITDYQQQSTSQGSKDPELMKKFQDGKPLSQIEVEKLFPDPTERKDALNFYDAKKSIDMYINMLDKLKSDPKRQGDYKYYTRPSMIKAHIEDPKAKLQKLEQEFTQKYGYNPNNIANKSSTPPTPPKLPSPPKPQLDKYGRQIGTPLPPGVQQDIEKGGKTASPVGDAAIMAAAAALLKGGFKGGAPGAETGSQLPARGSAEWQRMAKEYTRANPGQYNPFMTNTQNQMMQKYGVGGNAMPLRSLKNSCEPQGQLISERRRLKSPQEVLNKIPGYYDGKPAPLGFPVEPPPKMVNGMHPDLVDGKKVSDRFNRLDPESAKATPLTGNPHVDKKIKAARKQPK